MCERCEPELRNDYGAAPPDLRAKNYGRIGGRALGANEASGPVDVTPMQRVEGRLSEAVARLAHTVEGLRERLAPFTISLPGSSQINKGGAVPTETLSAHLDHVACETRKLEELTTSLIDLGFSVVR